MVVPSAVGLPVLTKKPARITIKLVGVAVSVALTFLGLLFVTFLIGRVVPIDPVLAAVGDRAPAEVYERVRVELGLHLPLYQQFWVYLGNIAHGDLGQSVLTANPVIKDILRVFPATLELATMATIFGVLFGIPIGVAAGVYQGRWPDQVIRVLGLFGYSVPVFWLGLMGLVLFYGKLGWVPGPGRLDVFYDGMIPSVTGVTYYDAGVALTAGAYVITEDTVITARPNAGYKFPALVDDDWLFIYA